MKRLHLTWIILVMWPLLPCQIAAAQEHHDEGVKSGPSLPDGVSLDETLDAAASGPPESWPEPVHDNPILSFTLLERLEYRVSDDQRDQFGWEAQGWIGNDDHKFWWKTEGVVLFNGTDKGNTNLETDEGMLEPETDEGEFEFEALYAKPFHPFWTAQVGVRFENEWTQGDSTDRVSFVFGIQGLAPYKFEFEPTLYLTNDGDLLGRLTTSYDLYLTQRLVLQPRTEINYSAQDVPDYALGTGFTDISLGLRLRYELRREFAPYVGIKYTTLLGETADIGRRAGSDVEELQYVIGVRIAF